MIVFETKNSDSDYRSEKCTEWGLEFQNFPDQVLCYGLLPRELFHIATWKSLAPIVQSPFPSHFYQERRRALSLPDPDSPDARAKWSLLIP